MADNDSYADSNRPLDKRILRYVWRHTRSEQLWILFIILASMPTYFMALTLPVRIVNEAIQGEGFEDATATQKFLELTFSLPDFLGGFSFQIFEGFELERLPYLIALSLLFFSLVLINGYFKYYINTYKGRLGERMLRRMRYQLVDRVLRFPINHFKRVKSSEVASMVKDEIEPFGEFIGDAFVQPAFLGGQALVAFIFIFTNSFYLGLIAMAIITIQITLIPKLRRPVLALGRQRQLTARLLSGRIGEIVEGITAVRVNDVSNYERAEISNRLGKIFFIRYDLYKKKFFIKFLNNLLSQFTPFLFYLVGGTLAIWGSLNVGQLIGVINAYKDLPGPINGLVQWDQKRLDINIKYAQIVEQFNVRDTAPAELQESTDEAIAPLEGEIVVSNLNVTDDTGSVLIDHADFTLPIHGVTAAVGSIGSGAGAVASTLSGILAPTSGRVMHNGQAMAELPEYVRGRRFAYAGTETYLPQSTLQDAMLYVTKHAPLRVKELEELAEQPHPLAKTEAVASGNTLLDYHADWIDYEAMGVSGPEEVYEKLREVLEVVEMDETVYELAMRQFLDPRKNEELCDHIIGVREAFGKRLAGSPLADSIEVFNWDEYNQQANIAENLLFGSAVEPDDLTAEKLAAEPHLRSVLAESGLDRELFDMGVELAETAIELFADLSPDNPFFEQLNFMTPEQLEAYPPILGRAKREGFDGVDETDRTLLIQLPFGYIEPKNRLRLLDDEVRQRLLDARKRFHEDMPEDLHARISTYNIDTYNPFNTIRDNILFGRVAHGASAAEEQVKVLIRELLLEAELEDDIFRAGLTFDIGTGGKRLSENQRQRLILARALLKGADLLIINRGLNTLDQSSQERLLERVLERARGNGENKGFGVFWVLAAPHLSEKFDNVFVFEKQKLVDIGNPKELEASNAVYAKLLS